MRKILLVLMCLIMSVSCFFGLMGCKKDKVPNDDTNIESGGGQLPEEEKKEETNEEPEEEIEETPPSEEEKESELETKPQAPID